MLGTTHFSSVFHLFPLLLLHTVYGDAVCRIDSASKSDTYRLHTDLFCDYSSAIRPVVNHLNTTAVTVKLVLKSIEMTDYMEVMTIDSWMVLAWKDEFLTWNPTEYGGVSDIHVESSEIWMPDISLYNTGDMSSGMSLPTTQCFVSFKGIVSCVLPNRHDAVCVPDFKNWPYDSQECTFHFGSWTYTGESLMFKLAPAPLLTDTMPKNSQWTLTHSRAAIKIFEYPCCPNSTFPTMRYTFHVSHRAAAHTATIVVPAIVLMIITVVSTALDPVTTQRIYLLAINVILHMHFLEHLSFKIQASGANCPLIILFARDSMLVTAAALFVTVIVRCLCSTKCKSPAWLVSVTGSLLSNKTGQLILLSNLDPMGAAKVSAGGESEEGSQLVSIDMKTTNNRPSEFFVLGKLLDRIFFMSVVIVYICYLFINMPSY